MGQIASTRIYWLYATNGSGCVPVKLNLWTMKHEFLLLSTATGPDLASALRLTDP